MSTYTITVGYDTFAGQNTPTSNWNGYAVAKVSDVAEQAFVYLPIPHDIIGATVVSATFSGVISSVFGSITMEVRPISSSWSASTLTWNRRPTVGPDSGSAIFNNIGQQTSDVTSIMQAVAAGANWYGFRVADFFGAGLAWFNTFESGKPSWVLTVVTSEAPNTPQALVPNGTVVSQAKPTLSCDFTDTGGLSDDMGAMQVQIDPAQNSTTPAFDSGAVSATVPVLDLTTTAYAGLASGATTSWRVRLQDTSGLWSPWSDWAPFTYRPKGTLTLLTPAAGVLWDPTSDIIASSSVNLHAYRVRITDADDRTAIRYDSGRLPADPGALTTVAVTLPQEYDGTRVLVDDRDYQLHIQAWDTFLTRQGTPGAPAYVESWSTFHFDDDLTQTPIASLTAKQPNVGEPAVQLTWTRASAPDGWIVYRDKVVIAKLDPVDVISGASTYSWTDPHPTPWVEHLYDVRPTTKVGGVSKKAKAGPRATITPDVQGIHIYTASGAHLAIDAGDVSGLTINDRRSTYKPLNVRYDVDIVTAFEGLSGTFTGGLIPAARDDLTVTEAMAIMQSIKENPSVPVKLVFGLFSGRVLLRNISVTPSPLGNMAVPLQAVSFGVNQVADFA